MRAFLCALTIFFSFSSCSKLSVGVYWADTFALSQIDDYFTLSSDQTEAARKEFLAAFSEVRRQDFPAIALILEGIAADVERGDLNLGEMELWAKKAKSVLLVTAGRFEPLGQRLVAQQAPQGFDRFDKAFISRHEKRGDKLKSERDRLKQAWKRIERVIDETVGSLSAEQETAVEQLLKENPLLAEHESRLYTFEQFKAARQQPGTREALVRRYFLNWDSLQKPEFIQARDAYQKKSVEVMLKVLASATKNQKDHLVSNFRRRAAELRKLSVVK